MKYLIVNSEDKTLLNKEIDLDIEEVLARNYVIDGKKITLVAKNIRGVLEDDKKIVLREVN